MNDRESRSMLGMVAVFLCLAAIASCMGSIDDSPLEGAPGPSGVGGTGGIGGSGLPPGSPSPDTGLWRLTRTEYTNTLRDLLGDTTRAGYALEANTDQASEDGFDKNAAHLASVNPPLDQYDSIGREVLEKVFKSSTSRGHLLAGCDPVTAACAPKVVSVFARRAWRRPVSDDEVMQLWDAGALPAANRQGDSLEEAVKLAFRMAIVAPSFLYRVEIDPPGAKGLHRVSPHELATRLSYFLWSSMPDDDLFQAAEAPGDRNLASSKVLAAQIARMLGDSKAYALLEDFAAQWLTLRQLAFVIPSRQAQGQAAWNDGLREPLRQEALRFFGAFLNGDRRDRNLAEMLDTDFTFVNDVLAKFYGLPPVSGGNMRPVPTMPAGTHRFGLLSQAGLLTVISNSDHTNIPKRAKWVLTNLFCSPPGTPPPNAGSLDEAAKNGNLDPKKATPRQIWKVIESKQECGVCHKTINPVGFALEQYNAIGLWRITYPSGAPIDTTGVLPDGTAINGAQDLSQKLKGSALFGKCFAQKMFAYALGRPPEGSGDDEAIGRLASDLMSRGGQLGELVKLVASSSAFQNRGGVQW